MLAEEDLQFKGGPGAFADAAAVETGSSMGKQGGETAMDGI
jgi:hypothetical protein